MTRLPFDPDRAAGARRSPEGAADDSCPAPTGAAARAARGRTSKEGERPWTVSQLCDVIGQALIDHLPRRVTVAGEVSNLSIRNHWYFSLKDEQSVISCVAWASKARNFGFDAEHGMQVVARGSVQFYGPQGRCQLYVDSLSPVGAGPLELKFRALCEELRGLGYFDPDRKRTIPQFPRNVAVITSAKGAALQDVLDTMRRRCPAVGVVILDVRVQGPQAAPEIVAALKLVERVRDARAIDAVVLTRGGGSLEDLWAFNERIVADALLNYSIPTIAAIGHETDTTIAELVADVRCATPTQAAMRITPDRIELLTQLDHGQRRLRSLVEHRLRYVRQSIATLRARLGSPTGVVDRARNAVDLNRRRLEHAMGARLSRASSRVDRAGAALERIRPHRVTAARERALAVATDRLHRALAWRVHGERERLELIDRSLPRLESQLVIADSRRLDSVEARLHALDPRSVVNRGYSITRDSTGRIVRRAAEVSAGERLSTHVSDGVIESDVIGSRAPRQPAAAGRRQGVRSRSKRRSGPDGQMDLFRPDR